VNVPERDHARRRGYWLIAVVVLVETASQILLKAGALPGGDAAHTALIAAGIALLALNFYFWPRALTLLPLSIAAPLTNLSVVTVPLAALVLLDETVTWRHWLGIGLILGGAILIPREEEQRGEAGK